MRRFEVNELTRVASPEPFPQGVAFHGGALWVSSCKTFGLAEIDLPSWNVGARATAPGEPFGIAATEEGMRVVVGFGEDADDRFIYRFRANEGFSDPIPCPDLSGAYLAYHDGTLFLSQAHNKRILALAGRTVTKEISLARRPVGITAVSGALFVLSTDDDFQDMEFGRLDLSTGELTGRALVPFGARGLAFDGSRFWTADRKNSELVAWS